MHASSNPSIAAGPLPATRWAAWVAAIAALIRRGLGAPSGVPRSERPGNGRAEELPWNSGMDRLAEQAYRPWILRP